MTSVSHSISALNTSGLIFDIRRFSVHDGPGIRTTVFFKGCPLDCWWCHNPESQSPMPEVMLWEQRCVRCGTCIPKCHIEAITPVETAVVTDREICTVCGTCIDQCCADAREMVGRRVSAEEVLLEIDRDRAFFEQSGGGVTFSGGEPLMQRSFLLALLKGCKEREIHTALDTSGFAPWEAINSVRPFVDLFLYDIKLVNDERHTEYTGVSNATLLKNLHALSHLGDRIILRVPVITGINDDPDSINDLCELASSLRLEAVHLLPYHPAAEGKYERLARPYRLPDLKSPSEETVNGLAQCIRELGLPVVVGG